MSKSPEVLGRCGRNLSVNLLHLKSLCSMNSTQEKTYLSFQDGILKLKFVENVVVEVEDVIYIYCYGVERAKGKPFALLFDTSTNHELSEEAMEYLGESDYLDNLIAMAYISKDLISKIRLSLLLIFERPKTPIKMFNSEMDGFIAKWMVLYGLQLW